MTDAAHPAPLPDHLQPAARSLERPALYYVTTYGPGPQSQFADVENDAGQSVSLGTWTTPPGQDDLEPVERFAALRVTGPEFTAALVPGTSFAVALDEVRDGAQIGDHVRVRVFAGPDPDHRGLCGVLVMRRPEAEALQALLGEARR